MWESGGGDVARGAVQFAARKEHRAFRDHERRAFRLAPSGGAFDAAAPGNCGVASALPIDGIVFGWSIERQEPMGALDTVRHFRRTPGLPFRRLRAAPAA